MSEHRFRVAASLGCHELEILVLQLHIRLRIKSSRGSPIQVVETPTCFLRRPENLETLTLIQLLITP